MKKIYEVHSVVHEEFIPKSWLMVKTDEICEVTDYVANGSFASLKENVTYLNEPDFAVLIRLRDYTKGWEGPFKYVTKEAYEFLAKSAVNPGDIVIANVGDPGKSFVVPNLNQPMTLGPNSILLKSNSKNLNNFLKYFFQSNWFEELIAQITTGTAQKKFNKTGFRALYFPFPPEKEQDRIVDKLEELFSELDEGVKELKAAQTKLSQYRQSLLKSAVEGSLTQQWRAENSDQVQETGEQLLARILKQRREQWQQQKLAEFAEKGKTPPKNWQDKYPEPVQPDTTDLPELPEGWVWATIDQCTMEVRDITDGPFGSNLKTEHYTKSGPRVIRLQNIGDGVFLDDKAHISKEHYATLSKHAIECDDVLVAMMGESLPRACIVPSGVAPAIVKADCARIRVNSEVLSPKLLTYYLNSNPVRNRTKSAVKGVGRPRINLGYIRSIVVPLPSEIEQKAIADKLAAEFDSIDRQIKATDLGLKQSEAQRKNILKSAFSGQLVPQDPNDEPASVLLEKIKREREALAKLPKPRKPSKPKKKVDLMNTLLEVLTAENDWIDAQDAFQKCGIVDGTSTDRIEEIYTELRKLEKAGKIQIQRQGDFDQLKLIKQDVKED
ncbi:TPA: restriction endonuclease subunit S [Vibrio cholerae]|uniref:restriction endonuclease subunit S n=1 Tax=Vibrio cholerae TaxID=666 RepID=UPI002FDBF35D|nr:restriction endonuclease subunit S [Vibrio cholerae]